MTVGTAEPLVEYIEDGATLTHSITFPFFNDTEIVVTRITGTRDSDSRILTLGVDYTVAGGAGDVGSITKTAGGTNGATLRIHRHTKRSQELDYQPGDDFPAESHEEGLDRLEMQIQEIDRDLLSAEQIRDLIANYIRAGFGIRIDVDDNANTITIVNTAASEIQNILQGLPDCLMLDGDQQTFDGAGGSAGNPLTEEQVRDIIGAALVAGTNITIAVDDAADTITINSSGGGGAGTTYNAGTLISFASQPDGSVTINSSALDPVYRGIPVVTKNAAFTFGENEKGKGILYTGGAANATINPQATTALSDGWTTTIRNKGTGVLTIVPATGVSLEKNGATSSASCSLAVGAWVTLERWGADDFTIAGPGAS